MKAIGCRASTVLLIIVLSCAVGWAQATAQINGTVKDQTGASLPGVEIITTQTDTGISRSTISNEVGSFVLPNLAIGPYRLEATLPGFRTYVQTGIVLQVNSNPVINAVLEVGQVSEEVEVTANAIMVETRSAGVGQVIENERIMELPLNGRNVTDLITLSGAAVQTGTTGNRSFAGSPIINMAGGLELGVAYMLDGASHNDPYAGQSQPMPFPDALQEFKVEGSGLSAQSARGNTVGAVTKSGTNEFHGDLFEFVRNDLFNARNYFATANSTLKRNQFGGTLGGPIKKNKLFFFGGYQRTTLRQDPNDTRQFVPTAAMLAGDFTAAASPACNANRQVNLRAPFVNNQINPALFVKPAVTIASRLPKSSDPCGLITFGNRVTQDDGQAVGKIDYQWSEKHSVFGRFIATTSNLPNPFDKNNLLTASGRGFENLATALTVGDTYLFGTSTINSFRLSALRVNVVRVGSKFFSASDVGVNAFSYLPEYMVLSVNGGFSIGGGTSTDSSFVTNTYQLNDDVSLVRGTHQMAFGVNLGQGKNYTISNQMSMGSYSFNGQTTGLGMADFFTGKLSGLGQSAAINLFVRQKFVGIYGQDTWKAHPRLTMNYGVRWDPYLPQVFTNDRIYNFDYGRFQQGIKSTVFSNAPAGFYYPGDPGFPGQSGVKNQWWHFDPRVGLAWDPQGNGRMSLRSSYGMSYAYVPLQMRIDSTNASPWTGLTSLTNPVGGFENPWQDIPGGNPFPVRLDQGGRFSPFATFLSMPYDIKPTVAHSWNLTLQRQLAGDMLVSASYLGSHQVHVWIGKALNLATYFPQASCTLGGVLYTPCSTTTNTNARRKLTLERPQDGQFIGALDTFDDGGTQAYHGLLVSVQRRASRGLTFNSNYTWSHCIGDNGDTSGMGPTAGGQAYQDPNNRRIDRGNCPGDRRQLFNLTMVAETPTFANPTLRAIATGWRLSPIFRMSSGQYLTITTGLDRALNGIGSSGRPNQILANPYGDGSLTYYLNPAAFQQPDLGTLGQMGRANIGGPSSRQFDVALLRTFGIRENQKLEVRAEAYNVTNSLRKGNPSTNLNSTTFGQITSSGEARILQFALKYVF